MFGKSFLNTSLKMRMLLLYTLFAVALVGGITYYAYHFTVDLLKKKEMSILSDSIEYLEKDISVRLKSVNEEYINVFDDDNFIDLYIKSASGTDEKTEQIKLSNEFQNYFLDMKIRNTDLIEAIYLFTNERVYSSEYRPQFEFSEFVDTPYYDACMGNKNRIIYGDFEPDEEYFSIIRSFYYTKNEENTVYPGVGYLSEKNEDYSTLVFFLKKAYLQELIREEAVKRQTSILILDQNGEVIVQEGDTGWLSEKNGDELIEEIKKHMPGEYEGELVKGRAGINIRTVDVVDWNIVYLYDMNILYRQAGQIRNVALLIFAVSVVIVFLIATFISGTVIRPIRALAKSMDEVVDNNMEVTFVPKYNDEIAYLGRRFSVMMQKIADLMVEVKHIEEQKRVEELKALQAQINPHFLYNTLDMVYWLCKMEGNDNAANLVADLADFFRLSLNKGEDITSIKKEMEHVRKYLEIQRVRMDEKFDYEIAMEEAVAEQRVPKLILQPLAENALLHGFENIDYQGKIKIEAVEEEKNIVFYISDNGRGMSKEAMEQLNRSNGISDKSYGYAIGNVKARIRLYAGDEYGMQFDTEVTKGTRVRVCFPMDF